MNRSVYLRSCAFFVIVALAVAGVAAEEITNLQVIAMIDAGFSEDIIVEKIANSQANFDLSTDAIVDLKNRGVRDAVIRAMIARADILAADASSAVVDPEPKWEGFSAEGISMKTLGGFGLVKGTLHFTETDVKGNFGAGANSESFYAGWSDVQTICAKIGTMHSNLLITTKDGKTKQFKFAFVNPSERKTLTRTIVSKLIEARDEFEVEGLASAVLSQNCGK